MRRFAMVVSAIIFILMLVVTVRATNQMSIPAAWPAYAANPWAVATLYDAYCGFLIFFLWVAYREQTLALRVLWFVLIMALGNMATSAYVFWQLWRLAPGAPLSDVLVRKPAV